MAAKVSAQAVVYSFHKRLKDHVPGLCSERDANRELAGGVVASLKALNKTSEAWTLRWER